MILKQQKSFIQKSSSDSLRGFQLVEQKPRTTPMRPGKTKRDRQNKIKRLQNQDT